MKNLDIIIDLLAYEGTPTNDPIDVDRIKSKTSDTDIVEFFRLKEQIADSTTDQVIVLPASPCLYSIIFTDRNISIKTNASVTALPLQTRANGKKTLAFFCRGALTGLTITNASGGAANVDIILASK